MPRALLSVYDKTGLIDFAFVLAGLGWDLVAGGGTEKALREVGLSVTSLEQVTGMPEMLGGRVKTLHPAVHAGILTRNVPEDIEVLAKYGYAPIDMVVCNLYPFQDTVARRGVALQDAIEQIDIGGVTLLRAAAKNFFHVIVLCDHNDYAKISDELQRAAEVDIATRRKLAVKAFAHTRDYDTAIHAYLSAEMAPGLEADALPHQLSFGLQQTETIRYGENPHQAGGFYSRTSGTGPLGGEFVGGQKQLSYNNYLDLNAAWRAVSSFDGPTVVIVKHLTPIGIATSDTIAEAYKLALEADPVSAFGSVLAVNREVDKAFVEALGSVFTEAIAAPGFSEEACAIFTDKRKNCRLVHMPRPFDGTEYEVRSVQGGMLIQRPDMGDPEGTIFKTVTERKPTPEEYEAMQYAWKAVQHVRSNAIVIAQPNRVVGVGGGLPSRVDAVKLAITKAGENAVGAALASDAYFPFADGVEAAITAGVTAVIQPGGSIRDGEVIEAANKANIAMIFTGTRHFRH
jgi:phosphoribosylaminoimidazolecarboxamide formyltransferase/IMP cyclohydrolase